VLEHAVRSAELSEAVESIVSNRVSDVSGTLRLSAPPSISDTLLTPLVIAFQASYPNVRIQILVTDRFVDHIIEGVDLVFRRGPLRDSSLVASRILTFRHQLVASGLHEGLQATPKAAGPARPPVCCHFPIGSRIAVGPSFIRTERKGNADVSAALRNERLRGPYARVAGGRRHWRTSAVGATRSRPQGSARRGHARLAFSDFRPLTRSSGKQAHFKTMSAV